MNLNTPRVQDDGSNSRVVVDEVEARQARRVGLIWVLAVSLTLAAIVGIVLTFYY